MGSEDHSGHRQRLKRRFNKVGEDGFADYELLELLLCYAIPRRDVKPLAKELLRHFMSLSGVMSAEPEELMQFRGISESTATLIKLSRSIFMTCLQDEIMHGPILESIESVKFYLQKKYGGAADEMLNVLLLDKHGRLLKELHYPGVMNSVQCDPKKLVKDILLCANVETVILAHNHPGNTASPSVSDIKSTRRLEKLLAELNITLREHFVITRNQCVPIMSNHCYRHPILAVPD